MLRAELIRDLPDMSAWADASLPPDVTQTLTDYEQKRAFYASQAESLRKAIADQETAEQELSSVERRSEQLRQAMQSLSAFWHRTLRPYSPGLHLPYSHIGQCSMRGRLFLHLFSYSSC